MLKTASERAFRLLKSTHAHVSFAESLTGGKIAATLIENSGASAVIDESYITYAAESKIRLLGVKRETIEHIGVVSRECALEMAAGVRRISGADWGVSTTGLAGPDGGTEKTPVGTVFIAVADAASAQTFEFHFSGDRESVRLQAVNAALETLCGAIQVKLRGTAE